MKKVMNLSEEIFKSYQDYSKEELVKIIHDLNKRMNELELVLEEYKWVEDALKKRTKVFSERVKELDCLYAISQLLTNPGTTIHDILSSVIRIVPSGWQYPEITCGRILWNNQEYKTDNFLETKWNQSSSFKVNNKAVGIIQIYYLTEKPPEWEGPFLKEERKLLNAISIWLEEIIERRRNTVL